MREWLFGSGSDVTNIPSLQTPHFILLRISVLCASFLKMSGHDNEDLIDYEDEHDIVTNGAITSSATNGGIATGVGDVDGDKDKKNFSGIHSTGFRFV